MSLYTPKKSSKIEMNINLTIISLSSLFVKHPLLQSPSCSQPFSLTLSRSFFKYSFSPVFFTTAFSVDMMMLTFHNSKFTHFLATPIIVDQLNKSDNVFLKTVSSCDSACQFLRCVFQSITSNGNGGALSIGFCSETSSILMKRCSIINCSAYSAGGFYFRASLVEVRTTCILKCSAIDKDVAFQIFSNNIQIFNSRNLQQQQQKQSNSFLFSLNEKIKRTFGDLIDCFLFLPKNNIENDNSDEKKNKVYQVTITYCDDEKNKDSSHLFRINGIFNEDHNYYVESINSSHNEIGGDGALFSVFYKPTFEIKHSLFEGCSGFTAATFNSANSITVKNMLIRNCSFNSMQPFVSMSNRNARTTMFLSYFSFQSNCFIGHRGKVYQYPVYPFKIVDVMDNYMTFDAKQVFGEIEGEIPNFIEEDKNVTLNSLEMTPICALKEITEEKKKEAPLSVVITASCACALLVVVIVGAMLLIQWKKRKIDYNRWIYETSTEAESCRM